LRLSALVAALLCAVLGGGFSPVVAAAQPPAAPAPPTAVDPSPQIEAVVSAARAYLGIPYRTGTEGPLTFDCSGLVYRAFSDTGQQARIGGARLRAAGYLRWFAALGRLVTDEDQATRGDLVIYGNGEHIGIYLGDGRVISALISGVTVHSLRGITVVLTGFLKIDWTGNGSTPGSAAPVNPADLPEIPVALVPPLPWTPPLPSAAAPPMDGHERPDMRTANSRTYQHDDGTFTTEFFAHPINYQPAGLADWQPIDLHFRPTDGQSGAGAVGSPVALALTGASAASGFLQLTAGDEIIRLHAVAAHEKYASTAQPQIAGDGLSVDYFDFLPEGIGLRVVATADGFKSFLALPREPRTNTFAFAVDAPGLATTLEPDGSVAFVDGAGTVVGRMPRPLLLDSSDVDGSGGGFFGSAVTLSISTDGPLPEITFTVGRHYLDEAVYPAYIDPTVVDFPSAALSANESFVSSRYADTNFNSYQRPEAPGYYEMWQGRQPGTGSYSAAYLRFAEVAQALGSATVSSAALEVYPYWQFTHDQARPTWIGRVSTGWDAATLTWNTQPATDLALGQFDTTQGQMADFDATAYLAGVLGGQSPDYGLQLAADGTGRTNWKRILDAPGFEPRLIVSWSGLRPVAPDVAAAAPTEDAGLAWSQPAIAPAAARYDVQVSTDDFASVLFESGVVRGSAGKESSFVLPGGTLSLGNYSWRVRTRYADGTWSDWSVPANLTVGPRPTPISRGALVAEF
jgi:hypothetical protein